MSHTTIYFFLSCVFMLILMQGCDLMETEPVPDFVLIKPHPELEADELELFEKGDAVFNKSFSVEEGVGPVFIATTCRSCHFNGGKGHPFNEIVRFGRWDADGAFDEMEHTSGPQLQYRSIPGYPAEEVPDEAEAVVHLNPPALAGLGLLEAISDEDILSWADPDDLDGDGISGRPAEVPINQYFEDRFIQSEVHQFSPDVYLGRFGKKAFSANLSFQCARAMKEDIGITSSGEIEDPWNHTAGPDQGDGVADPELSDDDFEALVFFLRSTAAPPRRFETEPDVVTGSNIFKDIGCVKCHRESYTTGITDLPYLNEQLIYPYSDMLLHDMGPTLDDGYTEGDAETFEWRTPPLWGLGLADESQGGNVYLMHDGRAGSIEDAIMLHGGEAEGIKNNFASLSDADKFKLIAFLESL